MTMVDCNLRINEFELPDEVISKVIFLSGLGAREILWFTSVNTKWNKERFVRMAEHSPEAISTLVCSLIIPKEIPVPSGLLARCYAGLTSIMSSSVSSKEPSSPLDQFLGQLPKAAYETPLSLQCSVARGQEDLLVENLRKIFQKFPQTEGLYYNSPILSKTLTAMLTHSTMLKRLRISECAGDGIEQIFSNLKQLTQLEIGSGEYNLELILANAPKLEKLIMTGWIQLGSRFSNSAQYPTINQLYLDCISVTKYGLDDVLKALPALKILDLVIGDMPQRNYQVMRNAGRYEPLSQKDLLTTQFPTSLEQLHIHSRPGAAVDIEALKKHCPGVDIVHSAHEDESCWVMGACAVNFSHVTVKASASKLD